MRRSGGGTPIIGDPLTPGDFPAPLPAVIVTPAEMRRIEEAAFAAGATAEGLMDRVGRAMAAALDQDAHLGRGGTVLVYAGKGNNAGDALVLAAALAERRRGRERGHLRFYLRLAGDEDSRGELPARKLAELPPTGEFPRLAPGEFRETVLPRSGRLYVVDGLLGIGARGPLRGDIREAAREINELRTVRGARVFALDVPTGVDAETGAADPAAVVADETLTVGFPKTGLLADAATNHVGRLRVIGLTEFRAHAADAAPDAPARGELSSPATLAGLLPRRPFDAHKGLFGRVGILAGSVGATGAAVMCAHACARAGAGLITLLVAREVYPVVAAAASPEVMVKPLDDPRDALGMDFDVLAVGPGLGQAGNGRIRELIARWPRPMVVDADGLNALAEDLASLEHPSGPRLLTPHPGEMRRLLHGAAARGLKLPENATRTETARAFTDRFPVTLLLKGARTIIAERGRPPAFNSTGNPGMATGGMGDVLTGICAALLGQRLSAFDAGWLGAWVHGQAADEGLGRGFPGHAQTEESLLPGDVLDQLGAAFRALRRGAG